MIIIARHVLSAVIGLAVAGFAGAALAGDEEILIDQQHALQGGITPGDAPGFPITLSQNGRYKLVGDLDVPRGRTGIEVIANTAIIDFNSFEMNGNETAWVGVQALDSTGASHAVTVLNGAITGFTHASILAGDYAVVESMHITSRKRGGLVLGSFGRVSTSAIRADGNAIECGSDCLIERNLISGGANGVFMTSGTVLGNVITGSGHWGIAVRQPGMIGFGNNTLAANNKGRNQIGPFVSPLQPNACDPSCQP